MKTVLIDFSSLDAFCGFGEIARQYLRCLAKSDVDDMRFVLMVPEKHKGEYGDRFLYISAEHAAKELRSEEHTSELQSRQYLVCRLLLEKKKLSEECLR